MTAALASTKLYHREDESAADKNLLDKLKNTFGQRACDIVSKLHTKHHVEDPFAVPQYADHRVHESFWTLSADSRDMEGEGMVKELASLIHNANLERQRQGLPAEKFVDPHFPPTLLSLFADEASIGAHGGGGASFRRDLDPFLSVIKDLKDIQWKRPVEIGDPNKRPVIYSGKKDPMTGELIAGGIDPEDVGQGNLGNCYYLAAIASCVVGDDDRLLRDLCIEDDEVASCGMYGVKFFLNGDWVTVLVDDLIPCTRDASGYWQPIFAKPMQHEDQDQNEKELWALIFEKAWAKLHLSYEATDAGMTADTTNYLTGGSIKKYDMEEDDYWNLLQPLADRYAKSWAFLSCSIRAGLPEEADLDHQWGLIIGHAYSILELIQSRTTGEKFVHVRNPWGDFEWKGRYNDKDTSSWTRPLIDELGFVDQADGSFWMLWDDFRYFFGMIEVCDPTAIAKVTEGDHDHCRVDVFSSHWIRGESAGGPSRCKSFKYNPVCILTVGMPGPVELSVSQPDIRPLQKTEAGKDVRPLTIYLYLKDPSNNTIEEIIETSSRMACYTFENARPGVQYQIIAASWAPGVESAFWISAAGPNCTLAPGPTLDPSQADAKLMSLNTPREMCCVVCHIEDEEGAYYDTDEGFKCTGCKSKKVAQGKGNAPVPQKSGPPSRGAQPPVPPPGDFASVAPDNNFASLTPSNNAGGGYGGYAAPSNNADGGYGGSYAAPSNNAGGGYDDYGAPPTDYGFPSMPKEERCYYCESALLGKSKMTQYGPCCDPPCWEPQQSMQRAAPVQQQPQRSAPMAQQQPQRSAPMPAAPVAAGGGEVCYYCEKPLAGRTKQSTAYGPACKPGCWPGGNPKPVTVYGSGGATTTSYGNYGSYGAVGSYGAQPVYSAPTYSPPAKTVEYVYSQPSFTQPAFGRAPSVGIPQPMMTQPMMTYAQPTSVQYPNTRAMYSQPVAPMMSSGFATPQGRQGRIMSVPSIPSTPTMGMGGMGGMGGGGGYFF
eukprot:CAMPEP_0181323370 /NCGR_PEP_ID=MMETSP1101-20121128/19748_1 /TAXON_ID=46948 /ORGANISM="Rhodomonas abbreviata, Strain Caron Lab Isolate" /LENGTH=994 /DNA_ID=CAMNT_0023431391 /DNA_START=45 /DNA_END=3029 /DNA_ORIENTATION=+